VLDDVLLLSSLVMASSGSGGPLATGTPPVVAVGLREAPLVVGLVRQASGGLGDDGSKAKAAARFLVGNTIVGAVYIG
jgi:hypothetical protein